MKKPLTEKNAAASKQPVAVTADDFDDDEWGPSKDKGKKGKKGKGKKVQAVEDNEEVHEVKLGMLIYTCEIVETFRSKRQMNHKPPNL